MRVLLITGFVFLLQTLSGQINLVPNFSFEDTSSCPNGGGQIFKSPPWVNPTNASPDYFNQCNSSGLGVPVNGLGSENAKTGVAYAGIYAFSAQVSNVREYIQVQLDSPLIANQKYCIGFYVNLTDSSQYAVDGMGCLVTANPVSSGSITNLPYSPQITNQMGNFLQSKNGWMRISGPFTASGGEQFITIGNFNDDFSTDTLTVGGTAYPFSYYYIDDVFVYDINSVADAGNDKLICLHDSVQIGSAPRSEISYSWTPSTWLSDPNISNPSASPPVTTTYILTQQQCSFTTTDTVIVTVNSDCDTANIFVPSAFSPNDDGQNDFLFVRTNKTKVESLDFAVYDRWGEMVFYANDITQGWDGRYKSEKLNSGVFFYWVKARVDGKDFFRKGDISLVR